MWHSHPFSQRNNEKQEWGWGWGWRSQTSFRKVGVGNIGGLHEIRG